MNTSLVDTHCHLCLDAFNDDLDQVLQRAHKAGVRAIVVPGIDVESSHRALDLARSEPMLHAAVGVHPNSAGLWSEGVASEIAELVEDENVVAVGEIGLDYKSNGTPRRQQVEALAAQLEIAHKAELPILVHNRQSVPDLLKFLIDWSDTLPGTLAGRAGVLHDFGGTSEQAQQASQAGFFLGVAGPVTFLNAHEARSLVSTLPLERLILETDSPYLSPHPYRGKRNEPARVRLIAEAVAEILGTEWSRIAERTTYNATYLFGWNHGITHGNLF